MKSFAILAFAASALGQSATVATGLHEDRVTIGESSTTSSSSSSILPVSSNGAFTMHLPVPESALHHYRPKGPKKIVRHGTTYLPAGECATTGGDESTSVWQPSAGYTSGASSSTTLGGAETTSLPPLPSDGYTSLVEHEHSTDGMGASSVVSSTSVSQTVVIPSDTGVVGGPTGAYSSGGSSSSSSSSSSTTGGAVMPTDGSYTSVDDSHTMVEPTSVGGPSGYLTTHSTNPGPSTTNLPTGSYTDLPGAGASATAKVKLTKYNDKSRSFDIPVDGTYFKLPRHGFRKAATMEVIDAEEGVTCQAYNHIKPSPLALGEAIAMGDEKTDVTDPEDHGMGRAMLVRAVKCEAGAGGAGPSGYSSTGVSSTLGASSTTGASSSSTSTSASMGGAETTGVTTGVTTGATSGATSVVRPTEYATRR